MIRSAFAAAATLLLVACNSTQSSASAKEATVITPWTISLTSSGGITGRGVGGAVMSSDGHATLTTLSGSREVTLSDAQVDRLSRALADALPHAWSSPPDPQHGADIITYTLTGEANGKRQTVHWREDTRGALDEPVRALVDAVFETRDALLTNR